MWSQQVSSLTSFLYFYTKCAYTRVTLSGRLSHSLEGATHPCCFRRILHHAGREGSGWRGSRRGRGGEQCGSAPPLSSPTPARWAAVAPPLSCRNQNISFVMFTAQYITQQKADKFHQKCMDSFRSGYFWYDILTLWPHAAWQRYTWFIY